MTTRVKVLAAVLLLGMTAATHAAWSSENNSAKLQSVVPVSRTLDDIARVIDKHKGAFYALFTRAARERPGLRGEIVLSFTIGPDGKVTRCNIASSTLYHTELERKIAERFYAIEFGAKGTQPYSNYSYPMTFISI